MAHRRVNTVMVAIALATCVTAVAAQGAGAQGCPERAPPDSVLEQPFRQYGVEGTFVLGSIDDTTCVRVNPDRASQRFLPASTFKIFNTMVALDEGSIPDETTVLEWDGVDRGSTGWNQDQDMRTAFRRSTLWFYQEVARRTGETAMRKWLERESYGNADTSGGIDRFWLTGGLRISAEEQVAFLRRLHGRELGLSPRAQSIAHALLEWQSGDGWTLFGKTGWTESDGRQIGWLVGWVERDGGVWFYAMNLETPDADFPMREARETIVKTLLARLGVLPES